MSKLFVFGIGGTGSRVIKSLAMLMASGVKINASEVVPIIIDVDKPNEDLTRTIDILKLYEKISDVISRPGYEGFFDTSMKNLYHTQGNEFKLEVEDVQGKRFKEYIDHQTLDEVNMPFSKLLFSQENLDLDMQMGFRGNPNLGSVVLNQFTRNRDFNEFARNFAYGDRIFIISSIHGGTGSAGFPLLVKNLRNADVPLPNPQLIKDSIIGAITVLPYFRLFAGEINSDDFISKTKAALEYYVNNVNPSLNSLYYIGYDDDTPNYENHAGGINQKNPAHFIELAAAFAIIDFMDKTNQQLSRRGQQFLEFGIKGYKKAICFDDLGQETYNKLFRPLTKYYLFRSYLDHQIEFSVNKQPWSNNGKKENRLTKDFLTSESGFYRMIEDYNRHYGNWLDEMANNVPAFEPFNLAISGEGILDGIIGKPPKKNGFPNKNYVFYDDRLNGCEKKISGRSREQKFIELFNSATQEIIQKQYS